MSTPFEYTPNAGVMDIRATSKSKPFPLRGVLGTALGVASLAGVVVYTQHSEMNEFKNRLAAAPVEQGVYDASVPIDVAIRCELPSSEQGPNNPEKIQLYFGELSRLNPDVDFTAAYNRHEPVDLRYREIDNFDGFGN